MSHCIKANIAKIEDLKPNSQYIELAQGFCIVRNTEDIIFDKNSLFVSTDYFGGMGEQYSELHTNGCSGLEFKSINDGLEFIGVVKGEYDEFDTLKLGNFRGYDDIELAFSVKYPDGILKIEMPFIFSTFEIQNTITYYNKIKERVLFVFNMLKGFSYDIDHDNNLVISPYKYPTETIMYFDIEGSTVKVYIGVNIINNKMQTAQFDISLLESDDALISKIALDYADLVEQYQRNNKIKSVIDLTGFTEQFKNKI
jgi:hypothetical protein